jgi:O-antigen/teichoic acid export membrane protein
MADHSRAIFKNTVALALSRSIEGASSIFLSFFVARRLGAAGLGIYSAAIVVYGLIATAAELGTTNFLIREIAKNRSRTSAYMVHLGGATLAASFLVMALARGIVPHLGYSAELRTCVYVVISATIPGTWRMIQEAIFVAHQRVEFITYTTLCSAGLNLSIALFLLHQGRGVISLIVAFIVVQYFVSFCYFLFVNRYLSRLRLDFQFSVLFDLLKGIRAFAGSSILGGLLARPEILILSLFRNDAQIGFYSAALRVVSIWAVIPQTYMTNVYPVLSQYARDADHEASKRMLNRSIKFLFALSLPLAVGIFAAARPITLVLYGPALEPSINALKIMAWTIPLTFVSSVLWRALAASGDQRLVLRAQLIMMFMRFGGGYLMIAWLASLGAAIETSVSLAVFNLMLEYYIWRNGISLRVLQLNWRLCVCALLMGTAIYGFVDRLPLWLIVPFAACLYGVLGLMLKAWTPEDVTLLRGLLPFRKRVAVREMSEELMTKGT